MIFTVAGSLVIFQALGLAYGVSGQDHKYQTGQCWGMDASSGGKLTVFHAERTKECCTTNEGQRAFAQFVGKIGDDLERCSVPGDIDEYLRWDSFVECCGASWKSPPTVTPEMCCGGKHTPITADDPIEDVTRDDECLYTASTLYGKGPWSMAVTPPIFATDQPNPHGYTKSYIWSIVGGLELVMLEKFECPKSELSSFSGAWFWQGEDTALWIDAEKEPIFGMKKPFDREFPPTQIPYRSQ
ncbi:MAG: hypothetical protein M1837_001412 [Sclerophora amabilis]|nr:MAG: hypothetical protein M1837_001412 [Sclerophora amabilis]